MHTFLVLMGEIVIFKCLTKPMANNSPFFISPGSSPKNPKPQ